MVTDAPAFGSTEGKIVPDIVMRPNRAVQNTEKLPTREERANSQLDKLPVPTGYRMLVVPYTQPGKTRGGILLAESTLKVEELATTIGFVIALGPDCYKDPVKYPMGPWCEKGDYVLFGRYAGARIMMQGEKDDNLPLRLLNDDEVLAKIDNPEDFVGVV